MADPETAPRYRFGTFEADVATGELRRKGVRIRMNGQPFQLLCLLLAQPGRVVAREEICRALWPDRTFVDYEHGVNSAINRIREALGDTASNPRFLETLSRRGYRFIAPVEVVVEGGLGPVAAEREPQARPGGHILASPEELPQVSHRVVRTLFVLLQLMYLGFYVGALANLPEIEQLLAPLPRASDAYTVAMVTAATLIPVRAFMLTGIWFKAPRMRGKLLKMWPFLLPFDQLWSLSPFLLLHHIDFGLALACATLLVYAPFAQLSLVLMGAAGGVEGGAAPENRERPRG